MKSQKPDAGEILPQFSAKSVETGKQIEIGGGSGKWELIIVYRGKHCGRCKKYLNILQNIQASWYEAGFEIKTVSADSREKAQQDIAEFGWTFPIACEMQVDDMRKLGLYISEPLSPDEADGIFAEPAVFVVRPDGSIQIVAISNGPSARPDLAELLDGSIFNIENDRPARGTKV